MRRTLWVKAWKSSYAFDSLAVYVPPSRLFVPLGGNPIQDEDEAMLKPIFTVYIQRGHITQAQGEFDTFSEAAETARQARSQGLKAWVNKHMERYATGDSRTDADDTMLSTASFCVGERPVLGPQAPSESETK